MMPYQAVQKFDDVRIVIPTIPAPNRQTDRQTDMVPVKIGRLQWHNVIEIFYTLSDCNVSHAFGIVGMNEQRV